jgi:hypothetical protein
MFRSFLSDALTAVHPAASFDPFFASFGNSYNTFTAKETPERIDVLVSMHRYLRKKWRFPFRRGLHSDSISYIHRGGWSHVWVTPMEIFEQEQVCWHWSCKIFRGKEHLVKNQPISTLDKVI